MAFSGLSDSSDTSSELTSDFTSTLTSELTLCSDEEAAPPTRPNDDPAPPPQVRLRNASMVVCPTGGKHVVPLWMVEFHLNHCKAGCAHASQRQPRGRYGPEDWEAECGEPSPLALVSARQPYFRAPPPGLTKAQRKKHYRDLVGDYREAQALQARYDVLGDDEQPGPAERISAEHHGDVASSPLKESKHTPEGGAALPRNAGTQDVVSGPAVAANSDFGDDDKEEAVKVVDEDGTTFYTGRGRGPLTPPAASPRRSGQWRPA